jgi:hypothetical protein
MAGEGSLVLRRPGSADAALLPVDPDVFSRGFGFWAEPLIVRFEFGRDSSAQITHFMIVTPSGVDVVSNLRFTRVR